MKFNKKIDLSQVVYDFNDTLVKQDTKVYEGSPIDNFAQIVTNPVNDDDSSFSIADPIYLLFDQQRLSSLGADSVKAWLDSMSQSMGSSVDKIRKQIPDDDLFYMIKSKNLQSPSEIKAWCDYLDENVDNLNSEIAKLEAEKKAKEDANNNPIEPVVTPTPTE